MAVIQLFLHIFHGLIRNCKLYSDFERMYRATLIILSCIIFDYIVHCNIIFISVINMLPCINMFYTYNSILVKTYILQIIRV